MGGKKGGQAGEARPLIVDEGMRTVDQLQLPVFSETEVATSQPVMVTPGRQRAAMVIWERDDEPRFCFITLEIRDGDGQLMVLRNAQVARGEAWVEALNELRVWAEEAWYDTHAPFEG